MKIEKFDELLSDYSSRLNKINKEDVAYKISIHNTVKIFFEKLNKIDNNLIYFYIKNLNNENINKNEIQQDALDYLILLTIKKKRIIDLFENLFPEYIETESPITSSWRVILWFKVLISFFIKPKPKLCNLTEAKRTLNFLRDMQDRLINTKNYLLTVDLERDSYNALSIIRENIFKKEISPLIYRSLDEENLLKKWEASYKRELYKLSTISDNCKENADIDTLLKYLGHRITLFSHSNENKGLSKKLVELKDLVFTKKLSSFEDKIKEIKLFFEKNSIDKNAFKLLGIYNLIEAVRQRFKLMGDVNYVASLDSKKYLKPHLNQLLNLSIDKIQFYYECLRENLDKQYEFCFENSTNFYNILNHLETIIYTNKNLFFHTLNREFDSTAYTSLSMTLDNLEKKAKELEFCSQNIDPRTLKDDVIKLSQFISNNVSILQTELQKESNVFITNVFNEEVYDVVDEEEARNNEELDDFDSEWDDEFDDSDISDTQSLILTQLSEDLGEHNPSTKSDDQSDSGVSDIEDLNPGYNKLSNQPYPLLFCKTPIYNAYRANKENLPILVH